VNLLRDCSYAVRSLRGRPGFTAAALLTIALGTGANTAVFSIVNAVLLRPLPYENPDRLVRIFETPPGRPDDLYSVARPTLEDWENGLASFEGVALHGPWSLDISAGGKPEQLEGASVSPAFFSVLRASPSLGRAFTAEEHRPGGDRAILLGDGLWRRRFGADAAVLGRRLTLDGESFDVIGVMPRGFAYPRGAEFWVTNAVDAEFDRREARHLSAIGRLKPGVPIAGATAELTSVEQRLAERFPRTYAGFGIRLIPLQDRIVGSARQPLFVLMAAVGAILLIACANVANLMLARAADRQRELAIRTALGASAGQVARQLLVESLVLSLGGALLGLIGAWWGLDAIRALGADRIPRIAETTLDARVLAFTLAIAIGSGLLVGLLPLVHAIAPDLHSHLEAGSRTHTPDRRRTALRSGLVVAQTAMALVLLAAAGLLIRSFARLTAVDTGLRTEGLLTFHLGLSEARAKDPAFVTAFYRDLQARIESLPGVSSAGMASRLPLSGDDHSSRFRLPGETPEPGQERSAQDRAVSPAYFRTLGVPVRGREFTETDGSTAAPVAMVNETFARRHLPGTDAVGQWIIPARAGGLPRRIVGVAGDTRQSAADVPAEPEFYLPHAQDPWPWLSVVVRTTVEPRSVLPAVERTVWSLDKEMPVTDVRTMEEMRSASVAPRRLNMLLLGAFAAIALVLAALGTYSVMAYIVVERRREMGIRLALGARPADVRLLMLSQGLRLGGLGAALGLLGAVSVSGLMRGLVFALEPSDPATLGVGTIVLGASVLLACILPARRAARLDPMVVLRE
jgi:predicted permease